MHLAPENSFVSGQRVYGHPWLGSYMADEAVS